jgi:heme exporter protein C
MKIHKLVYILMPIAIYLAFMWAPPAAVLGEASRILYFHVPVAFVSVIAFFTAGIESIIIILQKNSNSLYREEKAYNAALIGLVFSILTLVTGAIWANLNWGAYWNWDPRQTSIVILLLIYIAYFSLYSALADNENRGEISSVYLILAMIVMPLFVFIIPRVYDSLHPDTLINADKKMHLESAMKTALFVSIAAFTLLYFYIYNIMNRISLIKIKIQEKQHAL